MISTVKQYLELRTKGVRNAWSISGMPSAMQRIRAFLGAVMLVASILFLLSEQANAINLAADSRAASTVSQQQAYIAGLEKIVAACVTDNIGQPLRIGDEWFLCLISPLGNFK